MSEIFLYDRPLDKQPEINIWAAFPAIYSFGMSSLGYQAIFKTLDERKDYFVERIFTDTKTTQIPASQVDLMCFSFSFEIDFLGMFKILEKHNIPFCSKDRDESHPIIFAGGPVLTANPEPFSDFFDFIIIGDSENMDTTIIDLIKDNKELPKPELLRKLSTIEGIYVPSMTEFDTKTNTVMMNGKPLEVHKITAQLKDCVTTSVLSEGSYFSNTYIVEIARGCSQRCGFCLASYLNLPTRFVDYEKIIECIDFGLKYTNKIALLGALITAHPDFDKISEHILEKKKEIPELEMSVSSLRADAISPVVVKTLVACGQKNSTIAIEAGSERLRKLINKNLTESQIFKTIKIAQENGLQGIKIYAMIGHPTETQEDIKELIQLAKKLKQTYKGFDFSYSFMTFVPKAHTPFQFCKREDTKTLEKKYEYLKKEFHKLGIKINCSSAMWDYYQALISRGDRRLGQYLVELYKEGGNLGAFKQVYKKMHKQKLLPSSDYFATDEIPVERNLPWNFIKICPGAEALVKEYQRLLED